MAHEIFLRIEGPAILGESNETLHRQWIVIDSFSISITAAGGEDDSCGACTHSPMEISKHIDKSSPKLALAACKRTEFSKVYIDICKPTAGAYDVILKCKLAGVICVSYSLSGEDQSSDSFSLLYDSIEWHYTALSSYTLAQSGGVMAKWEVDKNTGY